MFKWIKRLLIVSFVVGILAAASYAGARLKAGQLLGSEPPVSGRTVEFSFKGAEELSGKPRVWIFTYHNSQLPGARQVKIYVSLTGNIVATSPPNLGDLLDIWERSQEP